MLDPPCPEAQGHSGFLQAQTCGEFNDENGLGQVQMVRLSQLSIDSRALQPLDPLDFQSAELAGYPEGADLFEGKDLDVVCDIGSLNSEDHHQQSGTSSPVGDDFGVFCDDTGEVVFGSGKVATLYNEKGKHRADDAWDVSAQ